MYLYLIGPRNSAKTVHFRFLWDNLKTHFLDQNLLAQQKIENAITIFQGLVHKITEEGKKESFSFVTYDFCFNEDFKLEFLQFEQVALFSTFITESKSIIGMPLIFWAAKTYFDEKHYDLTHLNKFFALPSDWTHTSKVQSY